MNYKLNLLTPSLYSNKGTSNCVDPIVEQFADYVKSRAEGEFNLQCQYEKVAGLAFIHDFESFEQIFLIHSEYAVIIASPASQVALNQFVPRLLVFLTSKPMWQNRFIFVCLGDVVVLSNLVVNEPIRFSLKDWQDGDDDSWIRLFDLLKVTWKPHIEEPTILQSPASLEVNRFSSQNDQTHDVVSLIGRSENQDDKLRPKVNVKEFVTRSIQGAVVKVETYYFTGDRECQKKSGDSKQCETDPMLLDQTDQDSDVTNSDDESEGIFICQIEDQNYLSQDVIDEDDSEDNQDVLRSSLFSLKNVPILRLNDGDNMKSQNKVKRKFNTKYIANPISERSIGISNNDEIDIEDATIIPVVQDIEDFPDPNDVEGHENRKPKRDSYAQFNNSEIGFKRLTENMKRNVINEGLDTGPSVSIDIKDISIDDNKEISYQSYRIDDRLTKNQEIINRDKDIELNIVTDPSESNKIYETAINKNEYEINMSTSNVVSGVISSQNPYPLDELRIDKEYRMNDLPLLHTNSSMGNRTLSDENKSYTEESDDIEDNTHDDNHDTRHSILSDDIDASIKVGNNILVSINHDPYEMTDAIPLRQEHTLEKQYGGNYEDDRILKGSEIPGPPAVLQTGNPRDIVVDEEEKYEDGVEKNMSFVADIANNKLSRVLDKDNTDGNVHLFNRNVLNIEGDISRNVYADDMDLNSVHKFETKPKDIRVEDNESLSKHFEYKAPEAATSTTDYVDISEAQSFNKKGNINFNKIIYDDEENNIHIGTESFMRADKHVSNEEIDTVNQDIKTNMDLNGVGFSDVVVTLQNNEFSGPTLLLDDDTNNDLCDAQPDSNISMYTLDEVSHNQPQATDGNNVHIGNAYIDTNDGSSTGCLGPTDINSALMNKRNVEESLETRNATFVKSNKEANTISLNIDSNSNQYIDTDIKLQGSDYKVDDDHSIREEGKDKIPNQMNPYENRGGQLESHISEEMVCGKRSMETVDINRNGDYIINQKVKSEINVSEETISQKKEVDTFDNREKRDSDDDIGYDNDIKSDINVSVGVRYKTTDIGILNYNLKRDSDASIGDKNVSKSDIGISLETISRKNQEESFDIIGDKGNEDVTFENVIKSDNAISQETISRKMETVDDIVNREKYRMIKDDNTTISGINVSREPISRKNEVETVGNRISKDSVDDSKSEMDVSEKAISRKKVTDSVDNTLNIGGDDIRKSDNVSQSEINVMGGILSRTKEEDIHDQTENRESEYDIKLENARKSELGVSLETISEKKGVEIVNNLGNRDNDDDIRYGNASKSKISFSAEAISRKKEVETVDAIHDKNSNDITKGGTNKSEIGISEETIYQKKDIESVDNITKRGIDDDMKDEKVSELEIDVIGRIISKTKEEADILDQMENKEIADDMRVENASRSEMGVSLAALSEKNGVEIVNNLENRDSGEDTRYGNPSKSEISFSAEAISRKKEVETVGGIQDKHSNDITKGGTNESEISISEETIYQKKDIESVDDITKRGIDDGMKDEKVSELEIDVSGRIISKTKEEADILDQMVNKESADDMRVENASRSEMGVSLAAVSEKKGVEIVNNLENRDIGEDIRYGNASKSEMNVSEEAISRKKVSESVDSKLNIGGDDITRDDNVSKSEMNDMGRIISRTKEEVDIHNETENRESADDMRVENARKSELGVSLETISEKKGVEIVNNLENRDSDDDIRYGIASKSEMNFSAEALSRKKEVETVDAIHDKNSNDIIRGSSNMSELGILEETIYQKKDMESVDNITKRGIDDDMRDEKVSESEINVSEEAICRKKDVQISDRENIDSSDGIKYEDCSKSEMNFSEEVISRRKQVELVGNIVHEGSDDPIREDNACKSEINVSEEDLLRIKKVETESNRFDRNSDVNIRYDNDRKSEMNFSDEAKSRKKIVETVGNKVDIDDEDIKGGGNTNKPEINYIDDIIPRNKEVEIHDNKENKQSEDDMRVKNASKSEIGISLETISGKKEVNTVINVENRDSDDTIVDENPNKSKMNFSEDVASSKKQVFADSNIEITDKGDDIRCENDSKSDVNVYGEDISEMKEMETVDNKVSKDSGNDSKSEINISEKAISRTKETDIHDQTEDRESVDDIRVENARKSELGVSLETISEKKGVAIVNNLENRDSDDDIRYGNPSKSEISFSAAAISRKKEVETGDNIQDKHSNYITKGGSNKSEISISEETISKTEQVESVDDILHGGRNGVIREKKASNPVRNVPEEAISKKKVLETIDNKVTIDDGNLKRDNNARKPENNVIRETIYRKDKVETFDYKEDRDSDGGMHDTDEREPEIVMSGETMSIMKGVGIFDNMRNKDRDDMSKEGSVYESEIDILKGTISKRKHIESGDNITKKDSDDDIKEKNANKSEMKECGNKQVGNDNDATNIINSESDILCNVIFQEKSFIKLLSLNDSKDEPCEDNKVLLNDMVPCGERDASPSKNDKIFCTEEFNLNKIMEGYIKSNTIDSTLTFQNEEDNPICGDGVEYETVSDERGSRATICEILNPFNDPNAMSKDTPNEIVALIGKKQFYTEIDEKNISEDIDENEDNEKINPTLQKKRVFGKEISKESEYERMDECSANNKLVTYMPAESTDNIISIRTDLTNSLPNNNLSLWSRLHSFSGYLWRISTPGPVQSSPQSSHNQLIITRYLHSPWWVLLLFVAGTAVSPYWVEFTKKVYQSAVGPVIIIEKITAAVVHEESINRKFAISFER